MHIALTWDQTTRSVYVDGDLKASDKPAPNLHPKSDLFISCDKWGKAAAYKGQISEIRIWNRALSQGEFDCKLDTEKPPDSLVRWYQFGVDVTLGSAVLSDLSKYKADARVKKVSSC